MFNIQSAIYEFFTQEDSNCVQCSLQDLIACDILHTQLQTLANTKEIQIDNAYKQWLLNLCLLNIAKDSNICHTEPLGEVSKTL